MSLYEGVLALISFFSFICIVIILVLFGWFLVWVLFLSRFRFVRELIGGMTDSSITNEVKQTRSKTKTVRKE